MGRGLDSWPIERLTREFTTDHGGEHRHDCVLVDGSVRPIRNSKLPRGHLSSFDPVARGNIKPLTMETKMNLPMQAPPVLRGQDRGQQMLPPPHAVGAAVAQSQLNCSTICALLPAPYNAICTALCPAILH
jgi:hypothetical protein